MSMGGKTPTSWLRWGGETTGRPWHQRAPNRSKGKMTCHPSGPPHRPTVRRSTRRTSPQKTGNQPKRKPPRVPEGRVSRVLSEASAVGRIPLTTTVIWRAPTDHRRDISGDQTPRLRWVAMNRRCCSAIEGGPTMIPVRIGQFVGAPELGPRSSLDRRGVRVNGKQLGQCGRSPSLERPRCDRVRQSNRLGGNRCPPSTCS